MRSIRVYYTPEKAYIDPPAVTIAYGKDVDGNLVPLKDQNFEVEEYIGKTDVSGKPIAVGDLVKMGKTVGKVEYSGEECGYFVVPTEGKPVRITGRNKVKILGLWRSVSDTVES